MTDQLTLWGTQQQRDDVELVMDSLSTAASLIAFTRLLHSLTVAEQEKVLAKEPCPHITPISLRICGREDGHTGVCATA